MWVPRLDSEIDRRLLVNYRVDPDALRRLLPAPLRPQLVDGAGVAGICLIRLAGVRPRHLPGRLGLRTENAAHRVAVEWDGPDGVRTGVFVPRRDTDSRLTVLLGGRTFPGVHSRARFQVAESEDELRVGFRTLDGEVSVDVHVRVVAELAGSRLFGSAAEASRFFEQGSVGWSPGRSAGRLEGMRLDTRAWRVEPVEIEAVRSSFFSDPDRFPPGTADLDCALVMRRVPVSWSTVPREALALGSSQAM